VLATWRPDYSTLVVAPRGGHGARLWLWPAWMERRGAPTY